jgi:hypothetical protein
MASQWSDYGRLSLLKSALWDTQLEITGWVRLLTAVHFEIGRAFFSSVCTHYSLWKFKLFMTQFDFLPLLS